MYNNYNSASNKNSQANSKNHYIFMPLEKFLDELRNENVSIKTIRNYKADIKQFIKWKSNHNIAPNELVEEYLLFLGTRYSKSSVRRKYYAIKKYLSYSAIGNAIIKEDPFDKKSKIPNIFKIGIAFAAIAGIVFAGSIDNKDSDTIYSNFSFVPENQISADINNISNKKINTEMGEFDNAEGVRIILGAKDKLEDVSDIEVYKIALEEDSFFTAKDLEAINTDNAPLVGTASISPQNNEYLLMNENIDQDSLLFVTATNDTSGASLYIKETRDGYAVIGVTGELGKVINFNWLIIDQEVYQSIL